MLERGDNKEVILFTAYALMCSVVPLALRLLIMI